MNRRDFLKRAGAAAVVLAVPLPARSAAAAPVVPPAPTLTPLMKLHEIMRNYYLPPVVEQLNNECLLLHRLAA